MTSLFVASSTLGGRGVFTTKPIEKGSLLEICPVIEMSGDDRKLIHQTLLHDYYFIWGENDENCAIILGYGSIYNHSYEPNAEYYPNYKDNTLTFYALNNIPKGSEITVNYNGTPDVQKSLWFKSNEQ